MATGGCIRETFIKVRTDRRRSLHQRGWPPSALYLVPTLASFVFTTNCIAFRWSTDLEKRLTSNVKSSTHTPKSLNAHRPNKSVNVDA